MAKKDEEKKPAPPYALMSKILEKKPAEKTEKK